MFNPLITNTINTEKEICNLKSIRDVEEIKKKIQKLKKYKGGVIKDKYAPKKGGS